MSEHDLSGTSIAVKRIKSVAERSDRARRGLLELGVLPHQAWVIAVRP